MQLSGEYQCILWAYIMKYDCRGSGDAILKRILMMLILTQIDPFFEWIFWNINAGVLGDAFYQANIDDANIDTDWCRFRVNILEYGCTGVKWCFYLVNIDDSNINAYCCIIWVNIVKYWCRRVRWCCFRANIYDENINTHWCIFQVNIVEHRCRMV